MSFPYPPPQPARLQELIDALEGRRVPMLVDLVADRFITGTPKRISREAPVLILRYEGESLVPGGGANAVANVAALGGRPVPLGIVGDDPSGEALRRIFAERGIETAGILTRAGYRTPTKTRILGGGRHAIKQQIVRFDVEDELVLTATERTALVEALGDEEVPVALVSDYGYGTADPEQVQALRRALGKETILLGDSRYRLAELRGLSGATPNTEEATTLLGQPFTDDAEGLEPGGRRLLERLGMDFLLITRGSAGMSLFTAEGTAHLPVHGTDQVADVTGAGDTVIGTFALALAAGANPLEAACLANYAGGVVVMKIGTATLSRDELHSALHHDPELLSQLRLVPYRT
jgi:rfaE bifunctional protein kinase chain/domain